jgi:hypothetical protein
VVKGKKKMQKRMWSESGSAKAPTVTSRRRGTLRERVQGDGASEQGSVLILALVYIIAISLIVGALADWAMNDLNNTTHFQSASSLDYAASSAVQVGIQSIRYTPNFTSNATLGECWQPQSGNVSQLTVNGNQVAVWCQTSFTYNNYNFTRDVSFYACPSTLTSSSSAAVVLTAGKNCVNGPALLYAEVAYGDYQPGDSFSSSICSTTCGYSATEENWTWSGTSGSAGQGTNTITVTSSAPGTATVGGATYSATATATSGDGVVITSGTTGVCTVATSGSNAVVSFVGTGTCTLDFNDIGNLNFAPATQKVQSFSVGVGSVTTTTVVAPTTTTTLSSSYAGSTGNTDLPNAGNANYYVINATSSGSSTSTNNVITPGVAETLTSLTFTIIGTSGSPHSATVDLITGGVVSASNLGCTVPAGSLNCTITTSVTVPIGTSINLDGVGNGNHTGTWTVTYTRP